jgi:outer membrane protein assembly factor BamB
VLALDTASGEILWDIERDVQISWSSPILIHLNGTVQLVLNTNPFVAGYDAATGKELWRHEGVTGEVAPAPAYAAGRIFVANEYSRLAAIDINGPARLLWENDEELPEVSSPLATEEFVFVATAGGTVACRKADSGEAAWVQEFDKGFYSSPILVGDRIYLMDRDGLTHIFKCAGSYQKIGECSLGEPSSCIPAFADGSICIRGDKFLYRISE